LERIEQKILSYTILRVPYKWVANKIKKKQTHWIIQVPLEFNDVDDYNEFVVATNKLMERNINIKKDR